MRKGELSATKYKRIKFASYSCQCLYELLCWGIVARSSVAVNIGA
jgi:hypothetical protein